MAATLARTLRAPRTRPRPVLRVRRPADRSAGHCLSPAAPQAPAGHRRWSFHIRVPGRFAWHELLRTKTERGGSPFSGSRPGAATGGFLSAAAGLTSTFRLGVRLGRALRRANHFTIPIITGAGPGYQVRHTQRQITSRYRPCRPCRRLPGWPLVPAGATVPDFDISAASGASSCPVSLIRLDSAHSGSGCHLPGTLAAWPADKDHRCSCEFPARWARQCRLR
jgi:hypothetical protein